jgi:hypothetical protein
MRFTSNHAAYFSECVLPCCCLPLTVRQLCLQYPILQRLEAEGVVEVACAKSQQASWLNAADWTVGTSSAQCVPPSTSVMSVEPVNVANRK